MQTETVEIQYGAVVREKAIPPPDISRELSKRCSFLLDYPMRSDRLIRAAYDSYPREYLKGRHHLSVKQVPDTLAIMHSRNRSLNYQGDIPLSLGFVLHRTKDREEQSIHQEGDEEFITYKPSYEQGYRILGSVEDLLDHLKYADRKGVPYRIAYEDFWKVLQGYSLACARDAVNLESDPSRRAGKYIRDLELLVWHGDKLSLENKIPADQIPGWNGSRRAKVTFADIASHEVQMRFIYEKTFWGSKLVALALDEKTKTWARNLQRKLDAFLAGKGHPSWSEATKKIIYVDPSLRKKRSRSLRLIECLKTVEGMFIQRFLAFPNESWSWDKFDCFVLRHLGILIDDEFLDGDLHPACLDLKTRYSELKKVRKLFKMYALSSRDAFIRSAEFEAKIPHWLRTFVPMYREAIDTEGDVWAVAIRSTLSQTRCMGTPPAIVVHQSKHKFLTCVSAEPKPLTEVQRSLAMVGMMRAVATIPDHAFSGLSTKARISLTTSACWEETKKAGGSVQAISDIIAGLHMGVKAKIIDLETGLFLYEVSHKEVEAGEYIFWRSLEEVLKSPPSEISEVRAMIVKEPAKARTVTKGKICLKIVLDVISKICSWPLKKVPSSKSGMGMDAHGWNLFNDFYAKEYKNITFMQTKDSKKNDSPTAERILQDVTYEQVFAECTDFENATDNMHHEIASMFARKWMLLCGIPFVLRRVVEATCFRPRRVVFSGRGIFSATGTALDGTDRYVTLKRGVMMGDPLTKVLLHLTNIASRELGRYIGSGLYKELILDQGVLMSDIYVDTSPIPVLIPQNEDWEDTRPIPADVPVVSNYVGFPRVIPIRQSPSVTAFLREKLPRPEVLNRDIIPGVHVIYGDENAGIGLDWYFIPKKYRDPLMRGRKFSVFGSTTWLGNTEIEDTDLLIRGYRPLPQDELERRLYAKTGPTRVIESSSMPNTVSLWSRIWPWAAAQAQP